MRQFITAKLKLLTTTDQKALLREVSLAYRDALNYTSNTAFENGKTSSNAKLHKLVYRNVRTFQGLPAQMATNVPRQVAATYKGLWTKVKQNKVAREQGLTQKHYKGLNEPPKFVSRTCRLDYQRDYSFKSDQRVSVITLQGRTVMSYVGYRKHLEMIQSGARVGTAKIFYAKHSKTYYLLVTLEIEVDDPTPQTCKRVVGVDVGQRYLAALTDTQMKTCFFSGKQTIHTATRYQQVRKRLQRKGTRSATRRLVAISGRERRFKAAVNHRIAKQIATPNTFIGMEFLKDIRERTHPRTSRKASQKRRRANYKQATWAFAELQFYVAYKSLFNGGLTVFVDANNTSKGCPRCGHTHADNRPNKGLMFCCVNCGYALHADLVGAKNVCLRALLIRQDWVSTGQLSIVPDVSSVETKAARLTRFAELRWTIDTSPRCTSLEVSAG